MELDMAKQRRPCRTNSWVPIGSKPGLIASECDRRVAINQKGRKSNARRTQGARRSRFFGLVIEGAWANNARHPTYAPDGTVVRGRFPQITARGPKGEIIQRC